MRMSRRFVSWRRTTATSILCAGSSGSEFDSRQANPILVG
jgi:hypothetical protein